MSNDQVALARNFLKTMDEQGDVFSLLTDDVELAFPKWGIARGKEELISLYQDLGRYIASTSHDPETFTCISGDGVVCIEGLSSGRMADGRTFAPNGQCRGRFCSTFRFHDGLISSIQIYIDPDYCDATVDYYPWGDRLRSVPAAALGDTVAAAG